MDVSLEKTKVCQEATKVCIGKTEATIRTGRRRKGNGIKIRQEKTKAKMSEANQENIEAVADHYNLTHAQKLRRCLLSCSAGLAMYEESLQARRSRSDD
jgi:hypothetical protein